MARKVTFREPSEHARNAYDVAPLPRLCILVVVWFAPRDPADGETSRTNPVLFYVLSPPPCFPTSQQLLIGMMCRSTRLLWLTGFQRQQP